MLRTSIITALAALATSALAQDAVQTDGDKYKVILENACVRVLDYQDAAGEKTHQHTHPAFVLYALGPFKRTLTLPGGKVITREFKAGDVMYSEAQTHVGENIGQTPTHVVIVELKEAGKTCSTKP
jgi:beta-alanine degradation protein BauB